MSSLSGVNPGRVFTCTGGIEEHRDRHFRMYQEAPSKLDSNRPGYRWWVLVSSIQGTVTTVDYL